MITSNEFHFSLMSDFPDSKSPGSSQFVCASPMSNKITQKGSQPSKNKVEIGIDAFRESDANFNQVTTSSDGTGDVNEAKIAEIQAKLHRGTYSVSSEALADAMVRKGFLTES